MWKFRITQTITRIFIFLFLIICHQKPLQKHLFAEIWDTLSLLGCWHSCRRVPGTYLSSSYHINLWRTRGRAADYHLFFWEMLLSILTRFSIEFSIVWILFMNFFCILLVCPRGSFLWYSVAAWVIHRAREWSPQSYPDVSTDPIII